MKEIAQSDNIDKISLKHCITQGIHDKLHNKAILFGCNMLSQFKENFWIYEELCMEKLICFNCRIPDHESKVCANERQIT